MLNSRNSRNSSKKPFNLLSRVAANIIVVLVDCYRFTLAGILGGRCRFTPTCSCYAREAFLTFGVRKGLAKSVKRLSRCHPWGGHGYDPVVPPESFKSHGTRSA